MIAALLMQHYVKLRFQPLAALAVGSRCEAMLAFLQVLVDSELYLPVYYAKAGVLEALGEYDDAEDMYMQHLSRCVCVQVQSL
jgi:hypothetical protein